MPKLTCEGDRPIQSQTSFYNDVFEKASESSTGENAKPQRPAVNEIRHNLLNRNNTNVIGYKYEPSDQDLRVSDSDESKQQDEHDDHFPILIHELAESLAPEKQELRNFNPLLASYYTPSVLEKYDQPEDT